MAHALRFVFRLFSFALFLFAFSGIAQERVEKEWTFLVYLNGHNNLDGYGLKNINQMETVGSSDKLNIVVQWASNKNPDTKRLYIERDEDIQNTTSPVIESLPRVDMGSYHSLVDFVKWAHIHYPAKHYFIDIWNHGSGWQRDVSGVVRDISNDDHTGNVIKTEQLGIAFSKISKIIGKKIDVVGMDACLMAMIEVAAEFSDYSDYFIASQEVIPAAGWPYDRIFSRWEENRSEGTEALLKMMTREYADFYEANPMLGSIKVSLSSVNLKKLNSVFTSVKNLSNGILSLPESEAVQLHGAIQKTTSFYMSEYGDFLDFLANYKPWDNTGALDPILGKLKSSISEAIVSNDNAQKDAKATGLSLWLPWNSYDLTEDLKRYEGLRFDKLTKWSKVIRLIFKKETI
jgi:hypothetical protein